MAEIPGLTYRLDAPLGGGYQRHQIGTVAQVRASVSYIPGAHNMKFGYYGGFSNPSQGYHNVTPFIQFRFRDGIPNQLNQTAVYPGEVKFVRNIIPTAFYAQDTWTRDRLTLQGGLRYDAIRTNYPDSSVGGPDFQLMPTRVFYEAGSTEGVNWKDITPRMSAAYDLFGNGRTAVKFNLGKYIQALTASNSDMDMNPLIRTALNTTRTWNDANRDYVPNCDLINPAANGECGAMDNQNFGKEVFTRFFDPAFIDGWGKRGYNWEMGVSVQHELMTRVGLTVGYFRRSFGNFYTSDNRLTTAADYTQFSIPIPADARLPGGGGGTLGGLYNLVPGKVGQEEQLSQLTSNFGKQIENWQGVDVGVNARLANGITIQAGTSTGRRLQDNCAVRAAIPETYSWAQTIVDAERARHDAVVVDARRRAAEPVLPRRRADADLVPRAGHVSRAEGRHPGERHVAERPGRGAAGRLRRDQRRRGAVARPQPVVGQRHRESDRARHVVRGSSQQHRSASGEDLPFRWNARAARVRHLQPDEHRRGPDLQPQFRAEWRVADAVDDPACAVSADQHADRFLTA